MREIKFRAWREGKYEIGSDGSIWSTDFNNSGLRREMKTYKDRDGYRLVWFTIDGKRSVHAVRRLVAWAFLGERPTGLVINHKNGLRDDDRAENLEYITSQANTLHGYRVNGRKHSEKQRRLAAIRFGRENNPKSKLTFGQVCGIREMRKQGFLLKEIAANYQISTSQVSAIARNQFWV